MKGGESRLTLLAHLHHSLRARALVANHDFVARFMNRMAWSVDRLGRSLQDLITFLSELHAVRVDLYLHRQGLDTTTPSGKAMFQMMGVFAEFERAMIQERVRAGLKRARDEGRTLGRPRIPEKIERAVQAALRARTDRVCARSLRL
jgi:DNA invertase Pin-like site-specific DNA recombinase